VGPPRHVAPHLRQAIHEGRTIELNHLGFVKRDYSYIDDIVAGTLAVLDKPAEAAGHRVYNLGAARSEDIVAVIALFEKALGREAKIELRPGDPFRHAGNRRRHLRHHARFRLDAQKSRWRRASRCLSSGFKSYNRL